MPSTRLWDGHDFARENLEFWSQEIFAAAQELEAPARSAFVGAACGGSDSLRRAVESLLAHAWGDAPASAFEGGACRPGDVVADCLILRPLGRGGMGEVYKAIQRPLRRLVAVKVVTTLPALANEAAMTAQLSHPNVVSVYHADLRAARPCIVMEYVDGISLRTWIDRRQGERDRPPADAFVRSIVRQVAQALGEAHRHGLVHRDIKPENILLVRRGEDFLVKVVDFGVARRLDTPGGPLVGTPGYIAPEQLHGAAPDPRADVFALGVTLYELLTGRQPFAAASAAETCFNTLNAEPTPPEQADTAELWEVARRALAKAPAERYQTTDALIAGLDRDEVSIEEPIGNPLLTELPAPARDWWERRPSGFLIGVGSFVWGSASMLLSIVSGAACVRVFWGGAAIPREHEMIYGYAIEPNAGPWYVVGASLCVLAGCAFLSAAHHGLSRTNVLAAGPDDAAATRRALSAIGARNRRFFRYATPAIIIVALGFVMIPELVFRRDHAFGWVQADLAVEQVLQGYDTLRRAGKVGDVPGLRAPCDGCEPRVTRVVNRSSGGAPSPFWFGVFLLVALGHQAVFVGFLIWIAAKIVFFFGLLSTALLGESKEGLRLRPDFADTDDYRFGLGRLDNVYYAILALTAVAAFGLFLQAAGNVSKGTYYFAGDPAPALFGQAVLLLGTLCLLAVVILTPLCVFLLLTIKAVDAELGRLSKMRKRAEAAIATSRSADDRERLRRELDDLRERRANARKQRLLPLRQRGFQALLAVVLVMLLVFPLSLRWLGDPARTANKSSLAIIDAVCAACGNPRPR